MTITHAFEKAVIKLYKEKIESPHLDSEILLSNIINKTREYIIAHGEEKLNKKEITKFENLVKRRSGNEPLAYLTGHKQFYGLDFIVNKHTLIPRPETELMVREALKITQFATYNSQQALFIDIGTGSGCIIITLSKLLGSRHSDIKSLHAIDFSRQALMVAKKNAKLHKVDKMIKFHKGDLLMPVIKEDLEIRNCNLVILANLPYLTPAQFKNSPTIRHEPKSALLAGADGLKYYKKLFKQIKKHIDINKISLHLLCEIDSGQVNKIKQLALSLLPEFRLKIKKDLRGLNRLVILFN